MERQQAPRRHAKGSGVHVSHRCLADDTRSPRSLNEGRCEVKPHFITVTIAGSRRRINLSLCQAVYENSEGMTCLEFSDGILEIDQPLSEIHDLIDAL